MKNKLMLWEIALMAGILCAIFGSCWVEKEQEDLAERIVRLHVIANSDSVEDQTLKLQVRDRILAESEQLYIDSMTREEACEQLKSHLDALAEAGKSVVENAGYSYSVTAQLTKCWFPTKEYEDFALPAGEYGALQIIIGEGKGQNWWCVAFPPLCVGAASQDVDDAVQAGYFTQEQACLLAREEPKYVLKFKSMELLGQWKEKFF